MVAGGRLWWRVGMRPRFKPVLSGVAAQLAGPLKLISSSVTTSAGMIYRHMLGI